MSDTARSSPQAGLPVRVLFVCAGNTCRSPMAEALLRHRAQAAGLGEVIQVSSAGVSAQPDEPVNPAAVAALARCGIDHTGAARRLTRRELQQADVVIVMDAANRAAVDALLATLPDPPACFYLMEFAPDQGARDVPDPYGTDTYDAVCALIDAGVSGLLGYLGKGPVGHATDSTQNGTGD